MKQYQKPIILCFLLMNVFYFPFFRIERSIVTDKHTARIKELKNNAIVAHKLSKQGIFKCEAIYFDTCSISHKILNVGFRGKELIFFINYKKSTSSPTRHFIKADIISPPQVQSFILFSSFVVLMSIVFYITFSSFLTKVE